MRVFFFLLVVLNVVYVAWELNREHPQQKPVKALPNGVEPIVLLSELVAESADNSALASAGTVDAVAQAADGTSATVSEPQTVADTGKAEIQTALSAQKQEPAVAGEHKPARAVTDKRPSVSAVTSKAKPAGDLCYTLGPFSEMKTLRLVTREIKDYVVEASFRSKEEQEQTMFRVLLRPVGSKQEAKALIKELVSKNIRDYFIITEGPNRNGISLGYFSDKGRAYKHAARVSRLGFDATAEPVFRSYTIYWLDYRIRAGNEIPQKIFDDYLENSSQRLSRTCS